jgi:hypothetical protein
VPPHRCAVLSRDAKQLQQFLRRGWVLDAIADLREQLFA